MCKVRGVRRVGPKGQTNNVLSKLPRRCLLVNSSGTSLSAQRFVFCSCLLDNYFLPATRKRTKDT